jgi:hypothetical protein
MYFTNGNGKEKKEAILVGRWKLLLNKIINGNLLALWDAHVR